MTNRNPSVFIAVGVTSVIMGGLIDCGFLPTASAQLKITEVQYSSSHATGSINNEDWWELTNLGTTAVNLDGYLWDDDDELFGDDYTIFPAIMIGPRESILLSREPKTEVEGLGGMRDTWSLPDSMVILSTDDMIAGPNLETFSGLSSTSGDGVFLYAPGSTAGSKTVIDSVTMPGLTTVPSWTAGKSFQFDAAGNPLNQTPGQALGQAVNGEFGAHLARYDGITFDANTMEPIDNTGTDVGSPGFVFGLYLSGDYNQNDVVDAADYTIWRDTLDTRIANGLGADGNLDGMITHDDFEIWKTNFGMVASSGGAAASVPEPTSIMLSLVASAALVCFRHVPGGRPKF